MFELYSLNARGMSITKSLYQIGMRCLKQMRSQNTTNTNSHRAFSQLKKSILAARWGWLTTYVLGQGVGKEKINKIMYVYMFRHPFDPFRNWTGCYRIDGPFTSMIYWIIKLNMLFFSVASFDMTRGHTFQHIVTIEWGFPTWDKVRTARPAAVQKVIRCGGLAPKREGGNDLTGIVEVRCSWGLLRFDWSVRMCHQDQVQDKVNMFIGHCGLFLCFQCTLR